MTESELRQELKALGWGLHYHARRAPGKRYAYAQKKLEGKKRMKYLCPEDKIAELDKDSLAIRLSPLSAS